MTIRRRLLASATAALVAMALAACGGGGSSDASPGQLLPVRLALVPLVNTATITLGIDKGIFASNGVDVQATTVTNAANVAPATLSGQFDGATFTWGSLAVVTAANLPIVSVGQVDAGPAAGQPDFSRLVTLPGSGITSVADLAGRTVAVNTLGGLSELQVRKAVRDAGGDPRSVNLIAVPFGNQAATLISGQVDAVDIAEPFLTGLAQDTALTELAGANLAVMENLPYLVIVMSRSFVDANPEAVARFQRGLRATVEYARTHEGELRQKIADVVGVSPDIAAKVTLSQLFADQDLTLVQRQINDLVDFGLLKQRVDASTMVARPAG